MQILGIKVPLVKNPSKNTTVLIVKCTKTHIYYAMKNCNGDAEELKRYIVNIVDHYQIKEFLCNLCI